MAPSIPPITSLSQPEPLHEALARDKESYDDCLPCRITGAGAFIGLGIYSYVSGQAQLRKQEAKILKSGKLLGFQTRQAGITGLAMTLVGLGVYRLVN